MAEQTFTIDDMIASVIDKQPETFKDAFNDLMGQRAAQAILDKKEELAQTVFASSEEEDEAPEEDVEDESEEASTEENEDQDESEDENGDQT